MLFFIVFSVTASALALAFVCNYYADLTVLVYKACSLRACAALIFQFKFNVFRRAGVISKALLLMVFCGQDVSADELSVENGANIFSVNCVLCHGATGEGDGRMAKVITAPPPANLKKSMQSIDYMNKIVTNGGDSMGRSPQMPAWGGELSEQQIKDVVEYVHSLRY